MQRYDACGTTGGERFQHNFEMLPAYNLPQPYNLSGINPHHQQLSRGLREIIVTCHRNTKKSAQEIPSPSTNEASTHYVCPTTFLFRRRATGLNLMAMPQHQFGQDCTRLKPRHTRSDFTCTNFRRRLNGSLATPLVYYKLCVLNLLLDSHRYALQINGTQHFAVNHSG